MKPNTHNIPISCEGDKKRAQSIIGRLPLEPRMEVIIQQKKAKRSLDQNALYWKWVTIVAGVYHNSKEHQHEEFKLRFLVPIFIRDDEQYADMVSKVKKVKAQSNELYKEIRAHVIRLTSTRDTNTKQMAEYMEEIELFAQDLNINLPAP